MEFSGLDLAAGRFTEISTYVVSSSVLPEDTMKLAMARLVVAWPAITWRVNASVGRLNWTSLRLCADLSCPLA